MNLLDPTTAIAALLGVVTLIAFAVWLRRRQATPQVVAPDDSMDTVQAWPPQAVRVMTLGERQAFEILRRALPGHVVLAQVPLSRFISVPTRFPYSQWLQRAGRLGVDLLVCDFSSRAVAAVEVRTRTGRLRRGSRTRKIDQRHDAVLAEVVTGMTSDPTSVGDSTAPAVHRQNLEPIGDHATRYRRACALSDHRPGSADRPKLSARLALAGRALSR